MDKIRILYDRRNISDKTHPAPIEFEVTLNQKRRFFGMGIKVLPSQFRNGKVVKHENADALNIRIDDLYHKIVDGINQHLSEKEHLSFEEVECIISGKPIGEKKQTFVQYVLERVYSRKDLRKGTIARHKSWLSKLLEFGLIEDYKDLTLRNIHKYDDWLREQGLVQTTIHGHHKTLKAYINECINFELTDINPYAKFKMDRGMSMDVKFLTEEELNRIRDLSLPDQLSKTRDLFVVQCYTGQAVSDFFKTDFTRVRDNNYVITDERTKTDIKYRVKLLKPAREILDRYNWVLPKISSQKYNDYLKLIQVAAGIETKLTSHVARHTFGVLMINRGVGIDYVAKMMGHSDTRTTRIYAEILGKTIDDIFDKLDEEL